ncbi:hypothetical protein EG850_11050 [Gulosibacter macacae]|uniref:Uncharacterized protein n=1 Tax=Gulosibacter macacae TaxID=2488791 RepID=A0A3P3VT36_9MICO|nr:hypothetical protein [Gulosibacter macacae]RRJ85915.1 hypothetical protein EG850_11050 [Gulosibacter macacae]
MDKYLDALVELPDLLEHLAHIVMPGAHLGDGQPRSRDLTPAPVRLGPLDQVDFSFAELWKMESYFREVLNRHNFASTEHMVRRAVNGEEVGVQLVVTDDPDTLRTWTINLTGRLRAWWPDVVAHSAWPIYRDLMDVWAIRPMRQWPLEGRAPVAQRPRKCPECGAEVWADLQLDGVRCDTCRWERRAERWRPVAQAATELGRSRRSLEEWISVGGVTCIKRNGKRHVELGECEEWRDYLEAKRRRNLRLKAKYRPEVEAVETESGDWEIVLPELHSPVVG